MSRQRETSPKLDLELNLSPPRANLQQVVGSPNSSVSSWELSPESSCVSSEPDEYSTMTTTTTIMQYPSSPEAITSMALVGCPRCLMYVMLSEVDPIPKCPRCKSTVLLDFLNEENAKKGKE